MLDSNCCAHSAACSSGGFLRFVPTRPLNAESSPHESLLQEFSPRPKLSELEAALIGLPWSILRIPRHYLLRLHDFSHMKSSIPSSPTRPCHTKPTLFRALAEMPLGDGNPEKGDFSEDAAASPEPSSSDNKKRRTNNGGSSSSRGVAKLTPDQLAKKRANDREAQRAIRERTKNQIENLERRIRELTSQQPYQELQQVLKQKELVEAENADIKKRLATVLSLIEPILGQHGQ